MEQCVYVSTNVSMIVFYSNVATCNPLCGAYQQCTAPDTCTCVSGYTLNGTMCIRKYKCKYDCFLFLM